MRRTVWTIGWGLFGLLVAMGGCGTDPNSTFDGGGGGNEGGGGGDGGGLGCNPVCAAGQKCSTRGVCIADGTCLSSGDCGPGTVCAEDIGKCVPGGDCGATAIAADAVPPNVLIVLDRSCSMTGMVAGKTKWQIAVAALDKLTKDYVGKIRFGLTMFPDTVGAQCTQGPIPIDCAPGTEPGIQTLLSNALGANDPNFPDGPCVTNIDTAMTQARGAASFKDTSRKSYALLLTDGAQAGCSAGGGDPGTLQTITDMRQTDGVGTFVIGFGAGVDAPALNSFATAGGFPANNVMAPQTKYYNAADQMSLDQALATIASQTLSCTYKLQSAPPDPSKLYVFVEKTTQVPQDPSHMNGWDYDPVTNTVTFYGMTCDDLKSGKTKVLDIVYGCPKPNPN